ncbi:SHOCT domain-containing protein [Qaidamihabitans albus]|uniref:SHOCT domain-containing protein n=1 Tax=Qaidamihabitans albus TaxID=2795733 RepID=UPI0018F246D8|nr:SHOCT domain-containing protein [Qaidamihabitans albus]
MPYWDHGDWGNGWLMGLLGLISMVVLWGGLIAVVVLLLRRFTPPARGGGDRVGDNNSALRILDERFAHGEIDEEEYQRRRDSLRR